MTSPEVWTEPGTTFPLSTTASVRPFSSEGSTAGVPPPANETYTRKTASTAATDSASTSRAGFDLRATPRV